MLYSISKESASLITTDGVRLDADIYRPNSNQSFPVLLMRQPYGREIASTVVYAHPQWYASHGYLVVIQDVRGCGTSQGNFTLFEEEIDDGYQSVNWAANLAGSTGEVGMYGFSYQGMTQLYAAALRPTPLKVLCPAMLAYDLYEDWAYENGAFCYEITLAWAIQLAAQNARKQGDEKAYIMLYRASKNLPIYEISSFLSECLVKYAPSNFYYEWLRHPEPGEYWDILSPKSFIKDVDLPMLHIGGAFDPHLRGTVKLYKEMSSRSRFAQSLIIGPWPHLPWGRQAGQVNYGSEAQSNIDRLQLAWFDTFLKGLESPMVPVSWFCMGSNHWKSWSRWPITREKVYFFSSQGLASIRDDDGKLSHEAPQTALSDILVTDKWRPVPSLGGHAALAAGSFDRASLDDRSDILTYTTLPLERDLEITGDVRVDLECVTNQDSFDVCVVLSDVNTEGQVYNFTQGYINVKANSGSLSIPLQPTCRQILLGHCLRLSVSGACFPAYAMNNQTEPLLNTPVTTLHLLGGKITLSTIAESSH